MIKVQTRILITLSFFLFSIFAFPNSIDSLKILLKNTRDVDVKSKVHFQLANAYNLESKSEIAIEYLSQAIEYARETNNILELANCEELYGDIYVDNEDYNLSNEYLEKSLVFFLELDSSIRIATIYGKIGVNYYYLGAYEKTTQYYLKSLEIYEKTEDQEGIAKCYNNIGTLKLIQKDFDLAKDYFIKALAINRTIGRKYVIAQNLNNLGVVYKKKGDFEKAIEYYHIALELNQKIPDSIGIARNLNNIANIYSRQSKNEKALDYHKRSLKIKMSLNNQRSVAQSLGNIANLYLDFAEEEENSSIKKQYIHKGIEYANKSLEIADELNILEEKYYAYGDLLDAYKKLGDFEKAFYFQDLYLHVIQELNNKDKQELSRNIEAKYQFNKKTRKIERQKFELEKSQNQIQKQELIATQDKYLRNFLIIIFLLMTVLASYVYYHFIQKKKSHRILEVSQNEISEKNEELNQQNEEILAQRDEIENKKDLLEEQKEDLEELHLHLTKSIDYAERIQDSLLSNASILKKYLSDYFYFYKPRDIVSGDFYWWNHVEGHTVIAAGDSTGHGVPGAFMSMLGISFLREIILKEYITHPGVILRKLRKEIVHSLKQTGEMGEQKDGMDMALISINHETKVLQYAGANNPIYIITNRILDNYERLNGLTDDATKFFYEIKPDKMPIAIYDRMDRFHTHDIQLAEGDQIYMFSDGYPDQFGGVTPMGKKFKYKPFKKLLIENSHLPMKEQREALIKVFNDWKGNKEQVDDILVLGIKI